MAVSVEQLLLEGLTYRQINHWTTRGYLRMIGESVNGRLRYWHAGERRVAALMLRLANAGLTIEAAHRVARGEHEIGPGVIVMVDGDDGTDDPVFRALAEQIGWSTVESEES